MLTIFSVPKPFEGHIETIQLNAIESWANLEPACEVILLGDDKGTAEAADRFGVRHIPDIDVNEYGTPRLDSVFDRAREAASHDTICYSNADIILLDDFLDAVDRMPFDDYLGVGRRWNIDLTERIDTEAPDWQETLRQRALDADDLLEPRGSDIFLQPRDSAHSEIPPFLVGRPTWDNWMIYKARDLGLPVVDMTAAFTMIHQNHGYGHVPDSEGEEWQGPEAEENREIRGGMDQHFNLFDTTHKMTANRVRPALSPKHLWYRIKRLPALHGFGSDE